MTEHIPTAERAHTHDHARRADEDEAPDWDPRGEEVRRDPVAAYDAMRSRCPVALGPDGAFTLFAHAEVAAAARDDARFSNAVSRHLQVPNGLDGPEHAAFRGLVDRYFTPERMAALEPTMRQVAADVVAGLRVPGRVDAVDLGSRFAVRAQRTWLGWPADLDDVLVRWVQDNQAASRSADPARTAQVARRFDEIIRSLTAARREAGDAAPDDVTTELVRDRVDGRALTDEEITSILRNWTGGDLGSMALCAGVVLTYLADHRDVQHHLRSGPPDGEVDLVLDEILRVDDPFVTNRRVTTEPVTVAGRRIGAGERVFLSWTAANRDPAVFGDPDRFDPPRNAEHNLVWGTGRHVCPGRPLATLELRALTRAVLDATTLVAPDPDRPRERGLPPVGGYAVAPLLLR
ncbi:cytochrome P450 [Thalassiella azotivora]